MERKRGSQDPEGLGNSSKEWKPTKPIVAGDANYYILRSDPNDSQHETIQFSIKRGAMTMM